MSDCTLTVKWMYADCRFVKLAYADPLRWSKQMPVYALRQDLTGATGRYKDNRPVFLKLQRSQVLRGLSTEESSLHIDTIFDIIDPKIKAMEANPFPDGAAALQAIDDGLLPLFETPIQMPQQQQESAACASHNAEEEEEEEAFETVDMDMVPEAYSLQRGQSGLTHIGNRATTAGYVAGGAAAVGAVVAAPIAGIGVAGAAAAVVVWGAVGYKAGQVAGTIGGTASGGGKMASENLNKISDLGAASRGDEPGQYQCGDYIRGITAHGKLTRGVDATSRYRLGDITRGIIAEQAATDAAMIKLRASQGQEEMRAKLDAAEEEAAAAKAELAALRASVAERGGRGRQRGR